jgi:type IV secretion system protein TrbJ
MKRILLAAVASIPFLIRTTPAKAVIVECANCSSIVEQMISDAKQVQQYALQGQQYAAQAAQLHTELQQYQSMVQNSLALPQEVWANVQNDIYQVRNLANAASLLSGNSGTILTRLQQAGYYANSASFLPSNIGQQFTLWQTTMGNATKSLANTLGVQQGQENSYTALQAQLQAHSQTAAGQMQAIQAGNELAALTSTQLNQIQTTLVAAAQETATKDAIAADQTASEDATKQKFLQSIQHPTTGGMQY